MIPVHVAIIMDGNGRWAKERSLPKAYGHKQGIKALKEVTKAANDLGVKVLTLYAFSTENWKRPEDEIKVLMTIFKHFLSKEIDELDRKNVKIKVLGDLLKFSEDIKADIEKTCMRTHNNTGLRLNIALNYGARQEILQAFEAMLRQGIKKPTEEILSSFLYTAGLPDPDLLIRTSGEFRLSNFLLWQIAYSEIYITDKFWPDFTAKDFSVAIESFQSRNRRFGGV